MASKEKKILLHDISIIKLISLFVKNDKTFLLIFFFQMKKETKKSFAVQGDCCAPLTFMPPCSFYLCYTSVNAIPALCSLSLRTAPQEHIFCKITYLSVFEKANEVMKIKEMREIEGRYNQKISAPSA
jgi:hypothetical protein